MVWLLFVFTAMSRLSQAQTASCLMGAKQLDREAVCSFCAVLKLKNAWRYTFTFPYICVVHHLNVIYFNEHGNVSIIYTLYLSSVFLVLYTFEIILSLCFQQFQEPGHST